MLPSKKIVALLIIVIAVSVSAYFISTKDKPNKPRNTGVAVVSPSNSANVLATIESSGDWKAALTTLEKATSTNKSQGTSPEKLNPTDIFARDFFAQFVNLKQAGVDISGKNTENFAKNYLASAQLPQINAIHYKETDLIINLDTSKTALQAYNTAFNAVVAAHYNPSLNEAVIIEKATTGNIGNLANLSPVIANYQKMLSALKAVSVPKNAAALHLNAINNLSTYIATLEMMRSVSSDPLSTFSALQLFTPAAQALDQSFANLRNYLRVNTQ